MKFDPFTKAVFTDNGTFIKKLSCPYNLTTDLLTAIDGNTKIMNCSRCNHSIVKTSEFTDIELQELIEKQPASCLAIDINQINLIIISDGARNSK